MIWKMICLTAVAVFIIDISGFTDSWKAALGRWLGVKVGRVRPFDCSTCCTFWACVILLLAEHSLTLPYLAVACLLAGLTAQVAGLFGLLRHGLDTASKTIHNLLYKIWDN